MHSFPSACVTDSLLRKSQLICGFKVLIFSPLIQYDTLKWNWPLSWSISFRFHVAWLSLMGWRSFASYSHSIGLNDNDTCKMHYVSCIGHTGD
jgi:hypothetical protein